MPFNFSMYFASPDKWSMQGIYSPSPLPRFTPFRVTSTRQQLLSLARRKTELVLEKQPVFLLGKCQTTAPHFLTTTANMSYSFPGSNWALRNFSFPLLHVSVVNFDMGFQIVLLELENLLLSKRSCRWCSDTYHVYTICVERSFQMFVFEFSLMLWILTLKYPLLLAVLFKACCLSLKCGCRKA